MASRKGSYNKSTYEIKEIFKKCESDGRIDWEKLFVALYNRGLKKSGDRAAQVVIEYKFGKAPQPIDMNMSGEVKIVRDNR